MVLKSEISQETLFGVPLNPLAHSFSKLRRARPTSHPSTAVARLQVIGSTCRLAGLLPAPIPHSDRPDFDQHDRSAHVCRLTDGAALLLHEATEVNLGLRNVRAYHTQPPW